MSALRGIAAALVADLQQMDADGAIDLAAWPAAQALVDALQAGA
ncbi:MAG: hypothetical protein Q8M17_10695 [Actinomycetota bacterium]|nr:hypothetical protein [Actinomycetota bacterium]